MSETPRHNPEARELEKQIGQLERELAASRERESKMREALRDALHELAMGGHRHNYKDCRFCQAYAKGEAILTESEANRTNIRPCDVPLIGSGVNDDPQT